MKTSKVGSSFLLRGTFIAIAIFYAFTAQVLIPMNHWREVFPFFHWSLFSEARPKDEIIRFKIVRAEDGQVACFFEECVSDDHPLREAEFYFLLQRFGKSFLRGGPADPDFLKKKEIFEARLHEAFPLGIRYALVKSDINVVIYAKTRETLADQVFFESEVRP